MKTRLDDISLMNFDLKSLDLQEQDVLEAIETLEKAKENLEQENKKLMQEKADHITDYYYIPRNRYIVIHIDQNDQNIAEIEQKLSVLRMTIATRFGGVKP